MRWLFNFWYRRQRAIDLEFLWPSCRDQAPDLARARAAFALHAVQDRAWMALGEDEIARRIARLS